MPPRNPQPGHPLADAAALENDQIAALAQPSATATPVPLAPADMPSPASTPAPDPTPGAPSDPPPGEPAPNDTPAPIDPNMVARVMQQNDTLLGRLDAESKARREAEERAVAAAQNREFTEKRLQELTEQSRRQAEELAGMYRDRDVSVAVSSFKSEHVDPDAFGDIYRGLHPHLQRFEQTIAVRVAEEVDKRVKVVQAESATREAELRKDLNERAIQRDVPEFGRLLDNPQFRDYLAETVPGTRSTRRAEVLAAWKDGDTKFIGETVAAFKLRGAPRQVDDLPVNAGRTITDQTPRQPVKEPIMSEDDLAAAFQQMNEGKITVADYRKKKAVYDKQELDRWRASKRTS